MQQLTCCLVLCGCAAVLALDTVPARAQYYGRGGVVVMPPYGNGAYGRRKVQIGPPYRGLGRAHKTPGQTRGQAANRKKQPSVNPKGTGKRADIDLASEVQALKGRHPSLVAKLPSNLRRLDTQALPTVEKLPLIAQLSYLTTVEDYPQLSTTEQTRFGDLVRGLSGLPEKEQQRYVDAASKKFNAIEANDTELKAARRAPHPTCFKLAEDLDVKAPAAAASTPPRTLGKQPEKK